MYSHHISVLLQYHKGLPLLPDAGEGALPGQEQGQEAPRRQRQAGIQTKVRVLRLVQ